MITVFPSQPDFEKAYSGLRTKNEQTNITLINRLAANGVLIAYRPPRLDLENLPRSEQIIPYAEGLEYTCLVKLSRNAVLEDYVVQMGLTTENEISHRRKSVTALAICSKPELQYAARRAYGMKINPLFYTIEAGLPEEEVELFRNLSKMMDFFNYAKRKFGSIFGSVINPDTLKLLAEETGAPWANLALTKTEIETFEREFNLETDL